MIDLRLIIDRGRDLHNFGRPCWTGWLEMALVSRLSQSRCHIGRELTMCSIICGVMTAPCGFLVLFVLPNYPTAAKRWYLTDDEFELAKARMAKVKRVQSDGLMKFSILKRIFSGWRGYPTTLTTWMRRY